MLRLATLENIPAINRVLNHPEVYPWATMGQDIGPLDIAPSFGSLYVLIAEGDAGCIILDPYDERTMELHTCLLPELRGLPSEEVLRDTLRFVFAETMAMEILTKVPLANKSADLYTRQAGFIRISDSEDGRAYQFDIERWPYQDASLAGICPEELAKGITDPHYLRVLGALVLMGMKGYMGKGVSIFNKHARLHGFPRVDVVGMDSIAVGGRTIHFEVNTYQVENLCQPSQLSPQAH